MSFFDSRPMSRRADARSYARLFVDEAGAHRGLRGHGGRRLLPAGEHDGFGGHARLGLRLRLRGGVGLRRRGAHTRSGNGAGGDSRTGCGCADGERIHGFGTVERLDAVALLVEVAAVEGVLAVVDGSVDLVFRHVGELLGLAVRVHVHGRGLVLALGIVLVVAAVRGGRGSRGGVVLVVSAVLLRSRRLRALRGVGLRGGAVPAGRGSGGQAVTMHLLGAQLCDDGSGHRFGDDVELAVLQVLVHDEAHERLAVHHEALFGGLRSQVRFRLARQRGVVTHQAAVVVRVH